MADEPPPYEWSDAWQDLLILHVPFRAADNEDFQDLLRQLTAIEEVFLNQPSLRPYYEQSMADQPSRQASEPMPAEAVHVCAMQLQLMEDAYFSLRLDQFANAPDNRGWMNLFRRWGRSPFFQLQFKALALTFSMQFCEFYQSYVENWDPIDDAPIPHPWDLTEGAAPHYGSKGRTHKGMQETWRAGKDLKRVVPGIYLDAGRREAGTPSGRPIGDRSEPMPKHAGEHGSDTDGGPAS